MVFNSVLPRKKIVSKSGCLRPITIGSKLISVDKSSIKDVSTQSSENFLIKRHFKSALNKSATCIWMEVNAHTVFLLYCWNVLCQLQDSARKKAKGNPAETSLKGLFFNNQAHRGPWFISSKFSSSVSKSPRYLDLKLDWPLYYVALEYHLLSEKVRTFIAEYLGTQTW
jgi:hypothetical protein